jgi:broad specificity phosphatase PhoE
VTRPLVYFARHGETDWNVSERIQGQVDTDINATGRAQADRNGDRLRELVGQGEGFDFVASPLRRTRETMERIRRRLGVDPTAYRVDRRLMEVHFGDWQGSTVDEIAVTRPDLVAARHADKWDFVPPGSSAESYAVLARRVADWLAEVETQTVCVTHGGCLRTLFHMIGHVAGPEAANLHIPQDRLLRLQDGRLSWI